MRSSRLLCCPSSRHGSEASLSNHTLAPSAGLAPSTAQTVIGLGSDTRHERREKLWKRPYFHVFSREEFRSILRDNAISP